MAIKRDSDASGEPGFRRERSRAVALIIGGLLVALVGSLLLGLAEAMSLIDRWRRKNSP